MASSVSVFNQIGKCQIKEFKEIRELEKMKKYKIECASKKVKTMYGP